MIEMEEEAETKQAEIIAKDKEIARLLQRIDYIEKNLLSGEQIVAKNLDGITKMEAQIAFSDNEKAEIAQELEYVR